MSTAPLSGVMSGTPPQAPPGMSAGSNGSGTDDRFSRMLEGGAEASSAPAANEAPAAAGGTKPAPGERADGGARDSTQPRTAKARDAGAARAEEPTAATGATAANDDASGTAAATAELPDPAGGWPPPGLASLLAPATLAIAPVSTDAAAALAGGGSPAPANGTPTAAPALRGGGGTASLPALTAAASPATSPAAAPAAGDPAAGALPSDALASLQPVVQAGADAAPEPGPTAFPLAPATGTGATQAAPATPVSAPPHAPVPQLHGEAFADDIGTHVQWLAGQKIGQAHIRISPQELGPVEIRLQLDGDRISADFSSAQPEVRQALENGLPRLREMLGQGGFQLAHAGVGQQSQHDGRGQGSSARGFGGDGMADDAPAPPPVRLATRGLLDAYA